MIYKRTVPLVLRHLSSQMSGRPDWQVMLSWVADGIDQQLVLIRRSAMMMEAADTGTEIKSDIRGFMRGRALSSHLAQLRPHAGGHMTHVGHRFIPDETWVRKHVCFSLLHLFPVLFTCSLRAFPLTLPLYPLLSDFVNPHILSPHFSTSVLICLTWRHAYVPGGSSVFIITF